MANTDDLSVTPAVKRMLNFLFKIHAGWESYLLDLNMIEPASYV